MILEKLTRRCRTILWATLSHEEMCAYIGKGGREVICESGNRLAGKNHCLNVCCKEPIGENEHVRLWLAAFYPDICLRYCYADLSISLLISISAKMKIETHLQLNKRIKKK